MIPIIGIVPGRSLEEALKAPPSGYAFDARWFATDVILAARALGIRATPVSGGAKHPKRTYPVAVAHCAVPLVGPSISVSVLECKDDPTASTLVKSVLFEEGRFHGLGSSGHFTVIQGSPRVKRAREDVDHPRIDPALRWHRDEKRT